MVWAVSCSSASLCTFTIRKPYASARDRPPRPLLSRLRLAVPTDPEKVGLAGVGSPKKRHGGKPYPCHPLGLCVLRVRSRLLDHRFDVKDEDKPPYGYEQPEDADCRYEVPSLGGPYRDEAYRHGSGNRD